MTASTAVTEERHLDVLVVGAGLSGIAAGHYLQANCPWASYEIFEARDAIGGTWDLFRYPGIRSDSDMFTLGYSFRPWKGEKAIADGESILSYIRETAAVEGIDAHIRFGHRVVAAEWSSEDARWTITAERTVDGSGTGEQFQLTAGFIFSCSGYYRYDQGYEPHFEGRDDFRGTIVHPQHWPEDLDWHGKRIVVIGSGATAVTLVPSLAKHAGHVTMLQRSPTYVTSLPSRNPLSNALRRALPERWSGPANRWINALGTQAFFHLSRRRPERVKRVLLRRVAAQLPPGYDVETHFTPKYDPWDQRLCVVPNGDLFRAISAGTASVVTDTIDRFTENGLLLHSGHELEADIVVTATGLDLLFLGGVQLSVDGEAVEVGDRLTYKGMMIEDVPNLALAIGYTNASWTLKAELTCEYVTRLLGHLRATGLRQCTARNRDTSVSPQPLLGLNSGYVTRTVDRFPKQGSRYPWQVYQSYWQDYRALKRSGLDDPAMEFSNPSSTAPARAALLEV